MTIEIHILALIGLAALWLAIGWILGRHVWKKKAVTREEVAEAFAEALENAPVPQKWMRDCYLNGQKDESEQFLSLVVETTTEIANK